jgi:16S rRNA (guanine527-N7)-methyltransferase
MPSPTPSSELLPPIDGPAAFAAAFPVSGESLERLEAYADLLKTWQRTMNLVAPKTLPELWHRHMADSAQLVALAPSDGHWVDFGAGAGFPGLVAAILRADRPVSAGTRHTLVESDARKCAFLGEVVRKTGLGHVFPVDILCARIEAPATRARLGMAKVVSARAVASLREILALSASLFGPETVGLFPKGRGVDAEIAEAEENWRFQHRLWPSRTDREASIVEIRGPEPRPRS